MRSLAFLCSFHLIETVDASVVFFHDDTELLGVITGV